ncbi:hypothetical protein D187_006411 [Cystobacter fuscus DSM 2262]|uniref:Lipoprotein n=1 Tax=Cystobacter fuscus (strain ATCC 25194 / DSM 2262 / NBRC 100088 / M29) TaxID=1242864 RepID=S9PIU9_CYSF2|nr:hypothetical protein [Cystobacter fuscus]EPX63001.1 hypothetical protein D187_006411 [Cystobacter fuscus DSM 2262]
MKLRWNVLGAVVLGLGLAGCGVTVGAACTSDEECGDMGFCITTANTPGGYCSESCFPGKDDTCPSGSTCVSTGARADVSACFIKCTTNADCRTGYQCISNFRGSAFPVCAAPDAPTPGT